MADKNWNDSSFTTGDRLLASEWVNHILYGHAINVSGGNISLGGFITFTAIGPDAPDNLSLFLNSSTNKLSYKDLNGSVQDLY